MAQYRIVCDRRKNGQTDGQTSCNSI